MTLKIIGAVLTLAACGGLGFYMAASYMQEARSLRQLIHVLDYMECEIQYRMTPLPELFRSATRIVCGHLSAVFFKFAYELDNRALPDVAQCMDLALSSCKMIPPITAEALQLLGQTLGHFDLQGQLKGIEDVRQECRRRLDELNEEKADRIRRYQTLGLCTGAALIILFI